MLIAFVDYCYAKVSGVLRFDIQSKPPDVFKGKVRCEHVKGEKGRGEKRKTIKEMGRQGKERDGDQEMKEKKMSRKRIKELKSRWRLLYMRHSSLRERMNEKL